jgi:WD40 repeat protein
MLPGPLTEVLSAAAKCPRNIVFFDDFELLRLGKRRDFPRPALMRLVSASQRTAMGGRPFMFLAPLEQDEEPSSREGPIEYDQSVSVAFAGGGRIPSQIEMLPVAVIIKILLFVPCRSVLAFGATCKRLRVVANDSLVWARLFKTEFQDSHQHSADIKIAFSMYWVMRRNWRHGRWRSTLLGQSHTSSVRALFWSANAGMLFSGASDRKVRVWTMANGTDGAPTLVPGVALTGPNAGVVSVDYRMTERVLLAGFRTGSLRAWAQLSSGQWDLLREHPMASAAEGFLFMPGRIAIWNEAVQVWDESTMQVVCTYEGHARKVTSVKHYPIGGPDVALSSSLDKTVKAWDMRTASALASPGGVVVFKGHSAGVNCVEPLQDCLLATGSNDRSIRVWDIRNPASPVFTIAGHVSPVKCLRYNLGFLVSGSDDHSMRCWDAVDFQTFAKLDEHTTPITCFDFDDRFLVSASSDGNIRLWDFFC